MATSTLSIPGVRNRFLALFGKTVLPNEEQRVERVLATARAFLAGSCLFAIWLDPTQPTRYATLAYVLWLIYSLHSLATLILVRVRRESTPSFRSTIHAIDVLWPAIVSFFTQGPNSPFFAFFTFVLLAAAYRWGFQETLATAGATIVLFFAEAVLTSPNLKLLEFSLDWKDLIPNDLIVKGVYLLIVGYLLGYVGEEEKRLQTENTGIARIITRVQGEIGLQGALRAVFDEILRFFGAIRAQLAVKEVSTGRTFLWEARRRMKDRETILTASEVDPSERAQYVFAAPGQIWHAARRDVPHKDRAFDLFVLDEAGTRLRNTSWNPPESLLQSRGFRSLLGAVVELGTEWEGRVLIYDPIVGNSRGAAAHFLRKICSQVSPTIYSVYLTRRLRSRAGAVERARVARELHDGVIQALIGLEMQVDVLRRQPKGATDNLTRDLVRIQDLLHQEVLNLRELMQQMKPVDLSPRQFLDFLAYTVDKFRRDTGISASFATSLQDVWLLPRVCNELARIVQEALANVRKHSGAKSVLVRFESQEGYWKLHIDDDGTGFDFSGRLTDAELDAGRIGPMVIKERAHSIGGEITVESLPGRGARLEIRVPQRVHGQSYSSRTNPDR